MEVEKNMIPKTAIVPSTIVCTSWCWYVAWNKERYKDMLSFRYLDISVLCSQRLILHMPWYGALGIAFNDGHGDAKRHSGGERVERCKDESEEGRVEFKLGSHFPLSTGRTSSLPKNSMDDAMPSHCHFTA